MNQQEVERLIARRLERFASTPREGVGHYPTDEECEAYRLELHRQLDAE